MTSGCKDRCSKAVPHGAGLCVLYKLFIRPL
jgi:hypothetical protein